MYLCRPEFDCLIFLICAEYLFSLSCVHPDHFCFLEQMSGTPQVTEATMCSYAFLLYCSWEDSREHIPCFSCNSFFFFWSYLFPTGKDNLAQLVNCGQQWMCLLVHSYLNNCAFWSFAKHGHVLAFIIWIGVKYNVFSKNLPIPE